MHSDVVEQSSPESQEMVVPRLPDATVSVSSLVAHVGVHDFSVDLVSSACAREESHVQKFVAQDDMQSSPPVFPLLSDLERLEQNDSPSIVTQVMGPYADGNMVLDVYENTHNSPRIHHDLELWRRISEYDAKEAEMPFTPVLSKKQIKRVKKQF